MELSHYDVLGVPRDADLAALRAAYRRRARETHPDAGGDDAEFAAVSLAWWTLSSPERRARYDAGDAGADDGWGEDVGWDDAPPPAPSRANPVPDPVPAPAPEPGPAPAPDPAPAPAPTPAPADPRVDAFTSGPRALPAAPGGPRGQWREAWADLVGGRRFRHVVQTGRRLGLLVACVVLAVVAALVVLRGALSGEVSATIALGLATYTMLLGATVLIRLGTRDDVRFAGVVTGAIVWGMVATFAGLGTYYLVTRGFTPARVLVVVLPALAGVAAAVEAGRALVRRRAREERMRRTEQQWALASRWNRLLALRAAHGAAHVEPAEQHGRPVWELVADDTGDVIERVPSSAPAAWARLLRDHGVDVAPVPRHPTRADAHA